MDTRAGALGTLTGPSLPHPEGKPNMAGSVIVAGARTPVGKLSGALASVGGLLLGRLSGGIHVDLPPAQHQSGLAFSPRNASRLVLRLLLRGLALGGVDDHPDRL